MRVWKLGNLERNIYPTESAVEKLKKLLEDDKLTDLIWGPDLEVISVPDDGNNLVISETQAVEFLTSLGYTVTKNA